MGTLRRRAPSPPHPIDAGASLLLATPVNLPATTIGVAATFAIAFRNTIAIATVIA